MGVDTRAYVVRHLMSGVMTAAVSRPPLAWRAAALLRSGIQEGRWTVGERLPSEPQLASELGISRATLREALRLLLSDGLLSRRHGVGTFVARVPQPSIHRGIDELFSLTQAIEQLGYVHSIGRHHANLELPQSVVANELRLADGAAVYHLRRIRLADARPVIVCNDFFPAALAQERGLSPDAAGREIVQRGSIYAWLEERLSLPIDSALTHIEPVAATAEAAVALAVPTATPLLLLRQTHFSPAGTPFLYSENLHNSDVIHFRLLRHRRRDSY